MSHNVWKKAERYEITIFFLKGLKRIVCSLNFVYCNKTHAHNSNKTFEAILLNFSGENSNFITNLGYDSPFSQMPSHKINFSDSTIPDLAT